MQLFSQVCLNLDQAPPRQVSHSAAFLAGSRKVLRCTQLFTQGSFYLDQVPSLHLSHRAAFLTGSRVLRHELLSRQVCQDHHFLFGWASIMLAMYVLSSVHAHKARCSQTWLCQRAVWHSHRREAQNGGQVIGSCLLDIGLALHTSTHTHAHTHALTHSCKHAWAHTYYLTHMQAFMHVYIIHKRTGMKKKLTSKKMKNKVMGLYYVNKELGVLLCYI